ncbi:hypothetical protein Btru_077060 [Bulinus truncatus]|nr:hypothetical protein Btru_077060 [Bulinus truncatus]
MTSYNEDRYKSVSRYAVQENLARIVSNQSILNVLYTCNKREIYVDICSSAKLTLLNKVYVYLNTTTMTTLGIPMSVCTCRLSSTKDVIVYGTDVRLQRDAQIFIQYFDHQARNVTLAGGQLLWRIDGKLFDKSKYLNISLKMSNFTLTDAMVLYIEGSEMSISCSNYHLANNSLISLDEKTTETTSINLSVFIAVTAPLIVTCVALFIVLFNMYVSKIAQRKSQTSNNVPGVPPHQIVHKDDHYEKIDI